MKYNKEQLVAALNALQPVTADKLREVSWQLPIICTSVASYCWINQIPEDDNTRLLRQAIKDLAQKGHFDYQ